MNTKLLDQEIAREGLSDVDWATSGVSTTLADRDTLSGGWRYQRVLLPVRDGILIVELQDEQPRWLMSTLQAAGELLNLPENWDSYGARPIDPHTVVSALELLLTMAQVNTPEPSVVPTCHGGVQLEWHTHGKDLEIEIMSPGRISVSYEDPQQDTEWEGALSSDLAQLSHFVNSLSLSR